MARVRTRAARKATAKGAKIISGLISNTKFFRTGKGGGKWKDVKITDKATKNLRKAHRARMGTSTSKDYRATFFKKNPHLKGKVVVHHAVEQNVLKKFKGRFTPSQMHSIENLRGIPKGKVNGAVHLSEIRKDWNKFYKANPNATSQQILDHATEVDLRFGTNFNPKVP
ncbi:hypothetical protein [Glycomyces harbinensis]|uniref:Uncharacterized protein n=1 Tax=Glycomyces harbinensis TaxID=58114 RepID=A0A1G6Y6J1_9ACTN|nr:hypothetical protein [Glycomyces harbinensis]SDD85892.1 hypothetical protein SAMN05216270_108159 [Glycomyces harbinensis]